MGAGITLNDPVVVEALSGMVDFVWIDTEHTPMGIETLLSQLIAARAGEIAQSLLASSPYRVIQREKGRISLMSAAVSWRLKRTDAGM